MLDLLIAGAIIGIGSQTKIVSDHEGRRFIEHPIGFKTDIPIQQFSCGQHGGMGVSMRVLGKNIKF